MQTKKFHFTPLNLPPANLRIVKRGEDVYDIYDHIRKKWLRLTDEEWVRQNFTAMLVEWLRYPASLVANEVGLTLNRTSRRADTVVYGRFGTPLMIIEYKAPEIEISQSVFDQIVRYNMVLRAPLLTVSNGLAHYCCAIDYASGAYSFLKEIPDYQQALMYESADQNR